MGVIRPYINSLSVLYRIADAVLVFAVLYISINVHGYSFNQYYINAGLFSTTIFLLLAESNDLYRSWRSIPFMKQAWMTTVIWLSTALIIVVVAYLINIDKNYSRIILLTWFVAVFLVLVTWRLCFRRILYCVRSRDFNTRSAAIIGVNDTAIQLAQEFFNNPRHGVRFLGYYDDRHPSRLEENVRLEGDINDLTEIAKSGKVDNIYISLPLTAEDRTVKILDGLSDTTATVSILPNFFTYNLLRSSWQPIGDVLTLSVHDTPILGSTGVLKRIEDIVLFLLLFPILLVPLLIISIAVKLSSSGPVIFRQKRYGLDGRQFEVFKFRTMRTLENGDNIVQAKKNDERVTPLGKVLRKYSLDELPQIFNVLLGDMSIIGPRPHAVAHNEEYRKLIRGYMLRHKIKPGITGWAQVNGFRGETETVQKMHDRVKYDLEYMQKWSLLFDLKILYLTVANAKLIISNAF